MAVDRVPVLKRCRSLGLDPIYLGIDKKSNRELKRANRKMSEYGLQLREKQKAKFIYGVLEKPFRNYYAKASRMNGMVGENLMILLERRLDNVVFRMGFGRTRRETRQMVDHKSILVNGKCVNIPSYLVKAGDVIEVKEKCKGNARFKDVVETTAGRLTPAWVDVDHENLRGTVKELPTRDENLMILLERRLDNVVFRMGFGRTRRETRQMVDHKSILVNGKCVNIPSYLVKAGDVIEVKEKCKGNARFKDVVETTAGRLTPAWVDVDHENLRGTVKELPTRDEIDVPVNEMLIVELYSK